MQDLEAKARQALECPCIDGIKNGPCGSSFVDAFVCYIKSRKEEKVSSKLAAF
jgi:intermembrane space import and assembly protein 40